VISGEYFGWSYGWNTAVTLGFLVATVLVATMYTTFIFSFTELSTAIPHAGGPFAYARRAFGPTGGFIAGFATLVEFVFAPPAIALAIDAYLNVQFPALNPKVLALGAYVIFIALNWVGIGIAAAFELFVTLLAIFELVVFMGVVTPGWSLGNFMANGWAGGDVLNGAAISGIFASISFAIWFFLAIEGAAMAAEEARDPHRTIPIAYIAGIVTLLVLAFGVMIFAGGVGDWRKLANINDPLPQAMKVVVGENSGWLHMLVWIGLFGLIASFHGIIMGYSRQIFALARAGYLPATFAALSPALQHAASCAARRRRDRRGGHLQRRVGSVRRPDTHCQHRHHVGARRDHDVPDLDGRAVQVAPHRARAGAQLPRAVLSGVPGDRAGPGRGVPGSHGLVQRHVDAAVRGADGAAYAYFRLTAARREAAAPDEMLAGVQSAS
jgi:amino acid transporter